MIKPSKNEKYFDIFPEFEMTCLPENLRNTRLYEDVMKDITNDKETMEMYGTLSTFAKKQFIQFCMGNRGLKITYDPFFKKIFNEERIEGLISCILGQKIKVIKILPRESYKMSAGGSIMIMDIIVMLEDGTIVNVEMQRVTHNFPMHRAMCYSSDIMMRQYDILKEDKRKDFEYSDLRPIYVIVLMESSTAEFNKFPNKYIHKSSPHITFDSGLKQENLFRYVFISLDIFRKMPHNKLNKLEAWMYVLSSDAPKDIARVLKKYPEFSFIYEEIVKFRYNPREMLLMLSEAIEIMDRNAVKSMVEELKDSIKERDEIIAERNEIIAEKDEVINNTKAEMEAKDKELKKIKAMLEKMGISVQE